MKKITCLIAVLLLTGGVLAAQIPTILPFGPFTERFVLTKGLTITQQNSTSGLIIKNAATFDPAYPPLSFQNSTGAYVGAMFIDPDSNLIMGLYSGKNYPGSGGGVGNIFLGSITGWSFIQGFQNLFLGYKAGQYASCINDSLLIGIEASPVAGSLYGWGLTVSAAAGAGLEVGDYSYIMTFVLNGVESNASIMSSLTTTTGNQVGDITDLPVYDGPMTCTARKIYRTKVKATENYFSYYLLTTINNNVTSVYTDTTADAALGAAFFVESFSIGIGHMVNPFMPNTMVFGGGRAYPSSSPSDIFFNDYYAETPIGVTLHSQGGSDSNVAGSDFTIAPGQGTGTGAGGSFTVKVAPAGTTGSTWNALQDALVIDSTKTATAAGPVKITTENITAGTGTGLTVNSTGNVNRQIYKVTLTYAGLSAAALTADHVIATLPAKTKLVAIYADTTVAYTGGAVSAATLKVGKTTGGVEYVATHDVFTAAVVKGLADADMGTSMTRAAAIQGGDLPSWTAATDVSVRLTTVTANTNALTAGSTTYYLVCERY